MEETEKLDIEPREENMNKYRECMTVFIASLEGL